MYFSIGVCGLGGLILYIIEVILFEIIQLHLALFTTCPTPGLLLLELLERPYGIMVDADDILLRFALTEIPGNGLTMGICSLA